MAAISLPEGDNVGSEYISNRILAPYPCFPPFVNTEDQYLRFPVIFLNYLQYSYSGIAASQPTKTILAFS